MRNTSKEVMAPDRSAHLDEPATQEWLSTLRQATRELHGRVEASLHSPHGWTLARYGAMLQAFHQVISPVEQRLCDLLGSVFIPPPFGRGIGDGERRRATQAAIDTFRAFEGALARVP